MTNGISFVVGSLQIPIKSSHQNTSGYLQHRLEKITKTKNNIAALLDPGRWTHPDIPSRQMLWLLILMCLQFKGDYWLRHLHPARTENFATALDEHVLSLVQTCIGVNIDNLQACFPPVTEHSFSTINRYFISSSSSDHGNSTYTIMNIQSIKLL